MDNQKLYRSKNNKMISGVIGGLAEIIKFDVTIIRVILALLTIFTGFFPLVVAYIVCAIIIPFKETDIDEKNTNEKVNTIEKEV